MDDFEDKPETNKRLARQQAIGTELRDVFGPVKDEAVPDALRKLAMRLDRKLTGQDGRPRLKLVSAASDKTDDD